MASKTKIMFPYGGLPCFNRRPGVVDADPLAKSKDDYRALTPQQLDRKDFENMSL